MNIQTLKDDLAELERNREQMLADLNAISGAKQYLTGLIRRLEAPPEEESQDDDINALDQ